MDSGLTLRDSSSVNPDAPQMTNDAAQEPLEGLVGYWPLDEGAGISVEDKSEFTNNGILRASTGNPWLTGYRNQAIEFNGSNDVVVSPTVILQPVSLTVEAWAKVDLNLETYGWIVGEGDNFGLVVNRENPGDLSFYFFDGTRWPIHTVSNIPFFDNEWHHFAATYDNATRTITLFFDGAKLSSRVVATTIIYGDGDGVRIASMEGERNFVGAIDEVKIYNRVLSSSEVAISMNEP